MTEIVVGRMYYNEIQAIAETHPKEPAHVQYIDGRFPDFAKINDSDFSTDGSNELIDSFPNAERYEFAGYIIDKLNFLFQQVGKYDAMLLLSCDEWIEGDWSQFTKNLQTLMECGDERKILNVRFTVKEGSADSGRLWLKTKPRLFVNPSHFSVKDRHWKYHYDGKFLKGDAYVEESDIEGIEIFHDNRVRSQERDDMMTLYQQILQEKRDGLQVVWPTRNKKILRKLGLIE